MKNIVYLAFVASNALSGEIATSTNSVTDYLQKVGYTEQFQSIARPLNQNIIFRGFVENRYPTNIVFSVEPWRYSMNAVQNSLEYKNKHLLVDLKRKLKTREHVHREGNESENISKLDGINKYMLCLVSKHFDHFERIKSWFSWKDWFPNGENSAEKGGIVFANKGLEYILVDTQWQKEYFKDVKSIQSNEVYLDSAISRYIGRIGGFHTHPKIGKAKEYAGPSGNLDQGPINLDGKPVSFDDMTSLTSYLDKNPLLMESVISWIDKSTVNVDVYFRDIVFTNDIPISKGRTIVIDLGNFKVPN
jgi:hypothetical protein